MSNPFTIEVLGKTQNPTRVDVNATDFQSKGREGDEGTKHTAKLNVEYNDRKRNAGKYFIKRIEANSLLFANHPEALPKNQKLKWRMLRKLGLPVLPTFRIDMSHEYIVQTDATEGGRFEIFDANNPLPEEIRESVTNLDQVKSELREIAQTAYDGGNGVYLSFDVYAVRVDQQHIARVLLLDLGLGTHTLEAGQSLFIQRELSANDANNEVEDFIEQVIHGIPAAQDMFYGG